MFGYIDIGVCACVRTYFERYFLYVGENVFELLHVLTRVLNCLTVLLELLTYFLRPNHQ